MTSAFSPDGSEVISRDQESVADVAATPQGELESVYDLARCLTWIGTNNVKKVALQFPDELLCDASSVVRYLSSRSSAKVFILGDTSYGGCCVDEVAAEHHEADSIIHFGHSCLSQTRRLPVLYVFGKWVLDTDTCVQQFVASVDDKQKPALVVYDLRYHHLSEHLSTALGHHFPSLCVALPDTSDNQQPTETSQNRVTMLGRTFTILPNTSLDNYNILYIGEEGQTLTNWMMNLNHCQFYNYSPQSTSLQTGPKMNRALMKRFYMIEKAKDAQIVGILAGTLGVADYLTVIDRLKSLIKKAGKKSYTFVVGKLNVAKLANFMEVDVYVLVSCPENTLIDSSEMYKPVVTPYEMEIACNQAREWTGDYVTDFRKLLPGESMFVEVPAEMKRDTDISLVTGGIRHIGVEEDESIATSGGGTAGQLVEAKPMTLSNITTAGDRLSERSWQGLEQKLGETPVVKAVQGLKGIAMGYQQEPNQ